MKEIFTPEWLKAASIRALRTFAQVFASSITVGVGIGDINWKEIASIAVVAAVYSLLTSIGGLPEVEQKVPPNDEEEGAP